MIRLFQVAILIILTVPGVAKGADIVINEVAWMGQEDSSSKEWIELYNPTKVVVSLTGWKLTIGKTIIPLTGKISPEEYYLLERGNDNTVKEEKADTIFKKALSNKGEKIVLSNNQNKIVDSIDCAEGWFAGDNKGKNTMERVSRSYQINNADDWQDSQQRGGTPKKENSAKKVETVTHKEPIKKEFDYKRVSVKSIGIALITALLCSASLLWIKRLLSSKESSEY